MRSFKGTNGAPTVVLERPMSTERGMAYGGRPLRSRSPRSSPSRGKPGTWRRRTGVNDEQTQRGMQNAKRRNCKLWSYIQPIKDVLPEGRHIQSEGMRADINNNLSERLQGTFRDRIKTLRGLDSIASGQRYLDGWVLTYNLFRGHESLRNKTPGERAKVNPPFKEWADVVKDGAASLPAIKAEMRPASQSPRKSPPRQRSGDA